jgi:hypothetical protein
MVADSQRSTMLRAPLAKAATHHEAGEHGHLAWVLAGHGVVDDLP